MAKANNRRKMGLWVCTSLVMGNMIGSGVFLLPSSLAQYGGVGLMSWLLTAGGATVLALLFARLARLLPKVGGPYAYSREGHGSLLGFTAGWGYWISIWAGNAAIAVAMVGYLGFFFPLIGERPAIGAAIAIVTVWALAAVNIAGVRKAGLLQLVTTILKLLPLLAIGLFGLFYMEPDHLTPFVPEGQEPLSAFSASCALTLWAFLGLESATIPADDVDQPQKTIPRATVLGVLIAAFIYILSTVSIMGVLPASVLAASSAPFADAATAMWGSLAGKAVAIGAVISTFGALNGWMMMGGQLPFALAQDALLPPAFSKVSKSGSPYVGILFTALMVTLLLIMSFNKSLVKQFELVILLSTLACLVPYLLCSCSEFLMRWKYPNRYPGALGKTGLVLSIVGVIYVIWAIIGTGGKTIFLGLLLLLAGIPLYYLSSMWRKQSLEDPS